MGISNGYTITKGSRTQLRLRLFLEGLPHEFSRVHLCEEVLGSYAEQYQNQAGSEWVDQVRNVTHS